MSERNVKCLWCGRVVPRWAPTHRVPVRGSNFKQYTREPNPEAGKPRVSGSMSHLDPDGFFCTMRCGVQYAVDAAIRAARKP